MASQQASSSSSSSSSGSGAGSSSNSAAASAAARGAQSDERSLQEAIELANAHLGMNLTSDVRGDIIIATIQAVLRQQSVVAQLDNDIVTAFLELGYTVPRAQRPVNVERALQNRKTVAQPHSAAASAARSAASSFFSAGADIKAQPRSLSDLMVGSDRDDDDEAEEVVHQLQASAESLANGHDVLTESDTHDIRGVIQALQAARDDVAPKSGDGVKILRQVAEWLIGQAAASGSTMVEHLRRGLFASDSKMFAPDSRATFELSSLAAVLDSFTQTKSPPRHSPKELVAYLFAARYMGYISKSDKGYDTTWSRAFAAECLPSSSTLPPHIAQLGVQLRRAYAEPQRGTKRKAGGPAAASEEPPTKNSTGAMRSRPNQL